ncbi:MAG: ROK family protein [Anaerolineaceae bacterium]
MRRTPILLSGVPNLKGWKNVDLRGALEKHFKLPVCVEYDGHTAVLGEWWMGAARDLQSVVSIIIGTGVGGGMVLDGTLIRGFNRLAGAVGWFIMERDSETDAVKERALGSWESRIAGPGMASRARQQLNQPAGQKSSLALKGEEVTAKDVFDAAKNDDKFALRIAEEEAELLGMGIANIVSLVNPEIIILGGSVGSNASFLLPKIKSVMEQYAQPISSRVVMIVTSQLGADAGLFGAAYGILLRLKNETDCSKGGALG